MNGPTPIMFIMFSETALPRPSLRSRTGVRVPVFSTLIACRIVHWHRMQRRSRLTLACTLTTTLCAQYSMANAIVASPDAQTLPEDRGADGLAQTLKKLHTWASVMIIVAHPDDEDGGMLTLESRGLGARTALMTLTRGEGGQDAMTSSTEDELGLIRTNELLLCDQYSGSEQFFSRVADYGFSKTIEEAHQKWGRDRVLYDVVRAVRLYRPLIVTSTFVGGITDGHGHHQVSGEAAQEVFKLAGDPNVFPDQIAQGLRPWSPLKVYARAPFFPVSARGMFDYATGKWAPVRFYNYVTGQWSDKAPSTDVEIHEGAFDPILGRSYLQMAREGWSQQKSQFGGGNAALPGPYSVAYHLYGSRVSAASPTSGPATNFFDGIDITLPGIATLAHGDTAFLTKALRDIDQHVMTATFSYLPSNAEKIAPELAIGYRKTKDLIDAVNASSLSSDDKANVIHELNIKLVQFNTALVEALGLRINALMIPRTSDHPEGFGLSASETPTSVTPGSEFEVRLHVTSAAPWGTGSQLQLARTWLAPPEQEHWNITRIGRPASTSHRATLATRSSTSPSRTTRSLRGHISRALQPSSPTTTLPTPASSTSPSRPIRLPDGPSSHGTECPSASARSYRQCIESTAMATFISPSW